uniref:Uncharacterized protein n=1 Tax=Cannabis sativa TaxID=3483 RepID=A0A803QQM5_CANSA
MQYWKILSDVLKEIAAMVASVMKEVVKLDKMWRPNWEQTHPKLLSEEVKLAELFAVVAKNEGTPGPALLREGATKIRAQVASHLLTGAAKGKGKAKFQSPILSFDASNPPSKKKESIFRRERGQKGTKGGYLQFCSSSEHSGQDRDQRRVGKTFSCQKRGPKLASEFKASVFQSTRLSVASNCSLSIPNVNLARSIRFLTPLPTKVGALGASFAFAHNKLAFDGRDLHEERCVAYAPRWLSMWSINTEVALLGSCIVEEQFGSHEFHDHLHVMIHGFLVHVFHGLQHLVEKDFLVQGVGPHAFGFALGALYCGAGFLPTRRKEFHFLGTLHAQVWT